MDLLQAFIKSAAEDCVNARYRASDPLTSVLAAASLVNVTAKQQAVLETFKNYGPMTDQDVQRLYRGPRQSESGLRSRRKELCDRGILKDSGVKDKLLSGRWAVIWCIVV